MEILNEVEQRWGDSTTRQKSGFITKGGGCSRRDEQRSVWECGEGRVWVAGKRTWVSKGYGKKDRKEGERVSAREGEGWDEGDAQLRANTEKS